MAKREVKNFNGEKMRRYNFRVSKEEDELIKSVCDISGKTQNVIFSDALNTIEYALDHRMNKDTRILFFGKKIPRNIIKTMRVTKQEYALIKTFKERYGVDFSDGLIDYIYQCSEG